MWVQMLPLPVTNNVNFGELHNITVPQYAHLGNGNDSSNTYHKTVVVIQSTIAWEVLEQFLVRSSHPPGVSLFHYQQVSSFSSRHGSKCFTSYSQFILMTP